MFLGLFQFCVERLFEKLVRFTGYGTIESDDSTVDREINDVLNLNHPVLTNNRRAMLDSFKATLKKRGPLQKSTLERLLREWNGESHSDDLEPYCQVVVYWLRKRLARP